MTGGTQQKPSQVGATIRVMREQAGLTQKGLAERASLTERTIRNLEYGVGRPRSNTVLLLAEALGLGAEQRQRLLDMRQCFASGRGAGPPGPAGGWSASDANPGLSGDSDHH